MSITNTIIATLKRRTAGGVACLMLVGVTPGASFAMTAQERSGCVATSCEVVAAATVTDDQKGGLAITDEKGRVWRLASFEGKAPVDMTADIDWTDSFAVTTAYDRYIGALHRGEGLGERASTDGRYHLCVHDGAVTCVYVPAR